MISRKIDINNKAPIKKGEVIGNINYYYEDVLIEKVDIIASESVAKIDYGFCFLKVLNKLLCRG